MNDMTQISFRRRYFSSQLFLLFLLFWGLNQTRAKSGVITDIILINSVAELVDLSPDGEILQRYVTIPDYFTSGKSHKRNLRESLAKLKLYGYQDKEQNLNQPVYSAPITCRQALMRLRKTQGEGLRVNHFGGMSSFTTIQFSSPTSGWNVLSPSFIGSFAISDRSPLYIIKQRSDRYKRYALC